MKQETETKQTTTANLVPVRVIDTRGGSALVEYEQPGLGLYRVTIPADAVQDGQADEAILALGIPYGVPWESVITLTATSTQLADQLRRAGIWTADDLQANSRAAYGALQAAYGVDLAAIFQAAAKLKEK